MPKPNRLYVIPLDTFVVDFEETMNVHCPLFSSFIPYTMFLPTLVDAAMGKITRRDLFEGEMGSALMEMGLATERTWILILELVRHVEKLLMYTLDEKSHHSNYNYTIRGNRTLYLEERINAHGDSDECQGDYD